MMNIEAICFSKDFWFLKNQGSRLTLKKSLLFPPFQSLASSSSDPQISPPLLTRVLHSPPPLEFFCPPPPLDEVKGGGGGGIGPPLSFEKNASYNRDKKNSRIDLEDFAKLTKCMVLHLVNFLPGLNYIL